MLATHKLTSFMSSSLFPCIGLTIREFTAGDAIYSKLASNFLAIKFNYYKFPKLLSPFHGLIKRLKFIRL